MTDAMQELKEMPIWVLHRLKKKPDGKTDKVPFDANGKATGADEKYRHTWVTFEEAMKAREKHGTDVGISFKVPPSYFFFDIDGRDVSDPYVELRLERFGSYAERSVSGRGIHIYGKCDVEKLPHFTDEKGRRRLDRKFYTKHPTADIELYCGDFTNRFAVYTGDVVMDQPLKDCIDALLVTLDKDMRRKPRKRPSKTEEADKELVDIVCNLRRQKNGKKFARLYDEGDFSSYGSQSEADAALCAMLAFRTGDNPELIDRLFRKSALYREKWEREDYRDSTIRLGIDACGGSFHKSVMPHPPFVFYDDKDIAHVNVPLLARFVRENLEYILVRDSGKQGMQVYVYEGGVYRLFDRNMLMGRIKQYIADYDELLIKMGQVGETVQHLTTDLNYVSQAELNGDEQIINFQNGLLRVTADELILMPHSPEVYSTIQIPCRWVEHDVPTPVFDRYMTTLSDGRAVIIRLLLEFIGVIISNVKGWRMKKALWMFGPGDTGKSQLKSLVEILLGKGNFIAISLREIEARFGTGAIYNTRLAGDSDMSYLVITELKTFKKITGGDSLFAEFKGQQPFEFTYDGFLWFCMNKLPKFGGDDGQWVYDRIMVVHCPNVIPKEKQDKRLLDKMYAEREGIVRKTVIALQGVIRNGYNFFEPECVQRLRDEYRSENSTVISFFEECMTERKNGKISDSCTTGKVYKVYRA